MKRSYIVGSKLVIRGPINRIGVLSWGEAFYEQVLASAGTGFQGSVYTSTPVDLLNADPTELRLLVADGALLRPIWFSFRQRFPTTKIIVIEQTPNALGPWYRRGVDGAMAYSHVEECLATTIACVMAETPSPVPTAPNLRDADCCGGCQHATNEYSSDTMSYCGKYRREIVDTKICDAFARRVT